MADDLEITTKTLAETDNFVMYSAEEPDGETTYNIQLGMATVHFFREEWEEFLSLVAQLKAA